MEKRQKIGAIVVAVLVAITVIGLTISYEINGKMSYSAGDSITYKVTSTGDQRTYIWKLEILEVEDNSIKEILHVRSSFDGTISYVNNSRTETMFDVNPLSYGPDYSLVGIELIHLKWGDRVAVHYRRVIPDEQQDIWTVHGLLVKNVFIYQTNSSPQTSTTIVFDSNIHALTG